MTDQKDILLLEKLGEMKSNFFNEIGKSVIGQHDVLNHILIGLETCSVIYPIKLKASIFICL